MGKGEAGRTRDMGTARAIKSLIIPLRHFISLAVCWLRRNFSPRLLQLIFLSSASVSVSVFRFRFSVLVLSAFYMCVGEEWLF